MFFKIINKLFELKKYYILKLRYPKQLQLCIGGGKCRFHKGVSIKINGRNSNFKQYGNFFARDFFYVILEEDARLVIGGNCFFNNFCSINCLKYIKIGDNCIFGENVRLYDHNHKIYNKEDLIIKSGFTLGEITIGNNCWFGSNVTILKDVHIGDNVVVGAGCVVYKDIPDNSILFNNGEIRIRE